MNKPFKINGRDPAGVKAMMTAAAEYEKTAHVYAVEAPEAGSIVTPEGEMSFAAGDMIVCDVPPTHAWPVALEVFKSTYRQVPRR